MAEKKLSKNRKRKYFEVDKSRQSPFQNASSRNTAETVVSKAPRGINAVEFAESRALEIRNMMEAVANASSQNSKRVFQAIPRHMRRRAASYNSKRMPVRLREAYKREAAKSQEKMKDSKKKKTRRHRRRPSNLLEEYNRRQRKYAWLETHIWHAKRFKMADQWGYKIPLHPNDKSIRASYRAMATGCLLQDLSYYQCIEVGGKEKKIVQAMKHLTNSDAGLTMGARHYLNGSREGHVVLYKYDSYPWNAVGPVMFLWQEDVPGGCEKGRIQTNTEVNAVTKLWVWSHPACFDEVVNEIVQACSIEGNTKLVRVKPENKEIAEGEIEMEKVSRQPSGEPYELFVTVLTEQLLRFRLIGPKSHALLASTLELCEWGKAEDNKGTRWWQNYSSVQDNHISLVDQNALWEKRKSVTSPGTLVSGSVIALVVKDPRLGLPLRKSSVDMASEGLYKDRDNREETFLSCTAGAACSPIWDGRVREEVKQSKIQEKELNEMRSKIAVPGSKLDLGENTSRIPVLIIQQPGTRGDTQSGSINFGCGYDLIIPAGWSMAFWIALVYRGARVGGARELATCSREQALPHFPNDFPDTEAGRQYSDEKNKTAKDKYAKYPPAKRPNYEKLGMSSPFGGDWTQLTAEWCGEVERLWQDMEKFTLCEHSERDKEDILAIEQLDKQLNKGDVDQTSVLDKQTWSIASSSNELTCNDLTSPTPSPLNREFFVIRSISTRRRLQEINYKLQKDLSANTKKSIKDSAFTENFEFLTEKLRTCSRLLVCLDLILCFKGCSLTNAVLFIPSSEDIRTLVTDKNYGGPVEPVHKVQKCKDGTDATSAALIRGCSRKAIGFVSSGEYSFARGQGAAVGFCTFPGLCEVMLTSAREKCRPLVLIRNTTTFQYRFASFAVV